jgi:hypothetical protein
MLATLATAGNWKKKTLLPAEDVKCQKTKIEKPKIIYQKRPAGIFSCLLVLHLDFTLNSVIRNQGKYQCFRLVNLQTTKLFQNQRTIVFSSLRESNERITGLNPVKELVVFMNEAALNWQFQGQIFFFFQAFQKLDIIQNWVFDFSRIAFVNLENRHHNHPLIRGMFLVSIVTSVIF